MEHTGIEPAASCLQNRRHPIATYTPYSPAAFLPAYLTYLLYTFSTPSSNLTVILSGYPDWSDVYGRCLTLTIFPFFLCPVSHFSHFLFIPVFCPANIAFPKCSLFHFFCSFSRVFFSLYLQYARIFKNAKFFADYFFVSAFSQEPHKTKWTAEESNLRRAGLQPAALPSELTVLIRRYKIAFPSFSPLFFFQHLGACSVSISKKNSYQAAA